jgi:hypothetical protein
MADSSSKYFGIKEESFAGGVFKYPVAQGTSSIIDVYGNHNWKIGGYIDEVPFIDLHELQLSYGQITANLAKIISDVKQRVAGNKTDPYQILYAANPTGFYYRLPYLLGKDKSIRGAIKNNWEDGGSNFLENVINKVVNAKFMGASLGGLFSPGTGLETPQNYKSTNPRTITITFPLYNTQSIDSALANYSFISLFGFQNLKTRTSVITYLPPKIYIVDGFAKGGIYMPAAYVSDYDVTNIGTLRRIEDWQGNEPLWIPEAYKVTIGLTELIPQSSNIMQGELGGSKTTVTQSFNLQEAAGNALNSLTGGDEDLVSGNPEKVVPTTTNNSGTAGPPPVTPQQTPTTGSLDPFNPNFIGPNRPGTVAIPDQVE